jgi:hypothetical protein
MNENSIGEKVWFSRIFHHQVIDVFIVKW